MIDLLSFTQCSWRCPYPFRYPQFARNPVHLSSLPEQLCASSSRLPHAVSWMREYTESIRQWPQMKYCYHNELACWRDRTFKFTRLITDTGGTLLFKEREDTAIRIHSSFHLCFLDSLVSWLYCWDQCSASPFSLQYEKAYFDASHKSYSFLSSSRTRLESACSPPMISPTTSLSKDRVPKVRIKQGPTTTIC